jgi:hypothetical protein
MMKILLTGAAVVSMDPTVGAFDRGDVLIEDGVIVTIPKLAGVPSPSMSTERRAARDEPRFPGPDDVTPQSGRSLEGGGPPQHRTSPGPRRFRLMPASTESPSLHGRRNCRASAPYWGVALGTRFSRNEQRHPVVTRQVNGEAVQIIDDGNVVTAEHI